MKKTISHRNFSRGNASEPWTLYLFVASGSDLSAMAIVQLRRIVAEYLPPQSIFEVIDLFKEPELAEQEKILAIPTLVRKSPTPVRRVIGDLSNVEQVLTSIGFVYDKKSMTSLV